ncbi:hypothetical protein KY343_03220 [Candidatus Woesearchaeota archaeon]|nr:hypothetical protein [Candidatus Woesearchaeota archaeon]
MKTLGFEEAAIEEIGQTEEAPEEREIREVIKAAGSIFRTEKGEKSIFEEERSAVQELCNISTELPQLFKEVYKRESSELKELSNALLNAFLYLRSHTIDKLNQLRKIRRTAVIIIAEAKQSEKYDRILRSITLSKSVKYRKLRLQEKLKDLAVIISVMKDIEDRQNIIKKSIRIIQRDNENMLKILSGESKEGTFKTSPTHSYFRGRVVTLRTIVEYIRDGYPALRWEAGKMITEMNLLKWALEKEMKKLPLLFDDIKIIELKRNRILRLMKQTGLKAA